MGLKDWIWNKAEKKIEEELTSGEPQNENLIQNDEVEKASYSDYSYKRVRKLREKGKYWGYEVPYLQYPVNKQEKPRAIFLVAGILYAIMASLMLVATFFVVTGFVLPLLGTALGLSGMFKIFQWDILGLFATISALVPIFIWLILIATIGLLVGINIYFISQTIKFFKMSKISMQEMAKGFEVQSLIIRLGTIMGIAVVVGVAILVLTRENVTLAGVWLVIGIMLAILAVISPFFILLIIERNKAKKQFDELSEEQQTDFIRHNQMLDRVHRKSNKGNKDLLASTKVDF